MNILLNELLTEEEQSTVEKRISLIQRYEEGEETLEDDIIDILDEMYDYVKKIPKATRNFARTIFYSKVTSYLSFGKIQETSFLYSLCDETFNYHKECTKKLKKYLYHGFKTGSFPDLEAAYLLMYYQTGLLYNINDCLNEIRTLESAYSGFYSYSSGLNINEKCDERREKVRTLVEVISPSKEDEKI